MTRKDLETLERYLSVKQSNGCQIRDIDIVDIVDFMRINCIEEPIDEEALDKLAVEFEESNTCTMEWACMEAFKAGYRAAKQE